MAGLYSVIRPRATTNLITNPSIGLATTGYSGSNASIVRFGGAARYGGSSLEVTPTANVTAGVTSTISLSASTTYTFSCDVLGQPGVPYQIIFSTGAGSAIASYQFTGTGAWQRVSVTATTTGSGNYILWLTKNNSASTGVVYTDGWQLEAGSSATTYCDGDQPGCLWNGARHASTSSRSAASRAGGEIVDLESIGVYLLDHGGGGMPPTNNIISDYGLLPGATYQRTKVLSRLLTLTVDHDDSQASDAFQALHDVRRELIELFDPFGVEGSQPTILRYTGGSEDLELDVFYDAGLEGGSTTGFIETATLRLLAPNPFWRQVGNSAKSLSVNETFADADYIVQRSKDGLWQALGGGIGGGVGATSKAVVYGPDGALYAAGQFTTAWNAAGTGSPLTVNNIAKWDGSVWSTLGATPGTNGRINDLAFDAAGNLYVTGNFTTAGGSAANYIAMWNGSAWSALGSGLNATGYALTVGTDGRIYVTGEFTSAGGVANTTYIAAWNGSAWSALGTGLNATGYALACAPSGNIYAGGQFTTAGGVTVNYIGYWTPTNSTYTPNGTSIWQARHGGVGSTVRAIAIAPDNTLYIGGEFTLAATHPQYIARSHGNGWLPLGPSTALNGIVYTLEVTTEGDLLVGGEFTTVTGIAWPDALATWRRDLTWAPFWIDFPGTARVNDVATYADGPINPDTNQRRTGRIAVVGPFSGTATSSNISDTTITNAGSAPAAPVIRITGPGVLETFVNMTTGREINFNGQTLQAGEVATLDLRPGHLSFTTTTGRNLLNTILSSHPTSFRLLRGDNTILVKMSGTTSASGISVLWQELHWSYDV
jgi:hypothetical protein